LSLFPRFNSRGLIEVRLLCQRSRPRLPGLGKGGQVTLYVDGEKVGEGTIPMTRVIFSADDGCDVGEDSGASVSQDYGRGGTVRGVLLAIGEAAESSDHLVSPEEAIRIAMARQ
jgi:hypothetical protein